MLATFKTKIGAGGGWVPDIPSSISALRNYTPRRRNAPTLNTHFFANIAGFVLKFRTPYFKPRPHLRIATPTFIGDTH